MHCIESLCRSLCIARFIYIYIYIDCGLMVMIEYILLFDILILLMICFMFWHMYLGELQLCMITVMCLHIIMQL